MIFLAVLVAFDLSLPDDEDTNYGSDDGNSRMERYATGAIESLEIKHAQTTQLMRKGRLSDADMAQLVHNGLLQEELRIQQQFQHLIHQNQHPVDCATKRHLLTSQQWKVQDGFTLELQWMGRYLTTAMATNRTLIIQDSWDSAYTPPECRWSTVEMNHEATNDWTCLYKPISNCTLDTINWNSDDPLQEDKMDSGLDSGFGIGQNESLYFDTTFYGPNRIVELGQFGGKMSGFFYIDVLPDWQRQMGQFWLRSQIAHYLWRPSRGLQSEISRRLPHGLLDSGEKYIAFHIRFTDNKKDLWRDFGRNANLTRSVDRFMNIAERIRAAHPEMDLQSIYVATDSNLKAQETKRYPSSSSSSSSSSSHGWNIVMQESDTVERSNGTDNFMWFRNTRAASASAVATDVEVMRRADFLVGSFQSNMYRLATQLNTAYHTGSYLKRMKRHFTVDIEWYEGP